MFCAWNSLLALSSPAIWLSSSCACSAGTNMMDTPQSRWSFCQRWDKHQHHEVTQYKKGTDSMCTQGKDPHTTGSRVAGGGRPTKAMLGEKAKTTHNIVLRLEGTQPSCSSWSVLAIKRCKHFELRSVEKGLVTQFYLLFYDQDDKLLRLLFTSKTHIPLPTAFCFLQIVPSPCRGLFLRTEASLQWLGFS